MMPRIFRQTGVSAYSFLINSPAGPRASLGLHCLRQSTSGVVVVTNLPSRSLVHHRPPHRLWEKSQALAATLSLHTSKALSLPYDSVISVVHPTPAEPARLRQNRYLYPP